MVIVGILAAVSIPRFANIVRQSEAAAEQGVLVNMVAALDTYAHEMDDSDWIYTGNKSDQYPNSIVHRRKEDSLAIWPYNPITGEIGYANPPYQPSETIYRPDLEQ